MKKIAIHTAIILAFTVIGIIIGMLYAKRTYADELLKFKLNEECEWYMNTCYIATCVKENRMDKWLEEQERGFEKNIKGIEASSMYSQDQKAALLKAFYDYRNKYMNNDEKRNSKIGF